MRKLFTILCAVMLTFSLSAQTEGGTFYLSLGNAYSPIYSPINQSNYFSRSNGMSLGNEWVTGITVDGDDDDDFGNDYWDEDEKEKMSTFGLGGQFGYFIVDGLLTGIGIEYASFSTMRSEERDIDVDGLDDEHTWKTSTSSFAFSTFVKYYISLGKIAPFISSSYTFGTMNSSWEEEIDYTSYPNINNNDQSEPYETSRLEFGAGMAFFLTKSISLEPSVNYALNTYTQEEKVYDIYDNDYKDQERKVSTNAFYFKIAASMYF